MPAVTRGGAKPATRPRGKHEAPPPRGRGRTGAPKPSNATLKPRAALAAVALVLAGGLGLLLATGGRAQAVEQDVGSALAGKAARIGFQVRAVEVAGASHFSLPYIVQAADVQAGQPILGLDLDQVRQRVEKVGWVKSVRVLRLLPDTLVIAVAERPRLAVWQTGGRSFVVDPEGQVIPEADPGLFVDLPLVVGDGANIAAAGILPEIQARPRLMGRLEALVRVDDRRWDLRLKDGSLIQLPATEEDSALIQLDQLDQKDRLFDLGFERIDLRDPEMIAVKPRQPADTPTAGAAPLLAALQQQPAAAIPAPRQAPGE